jgi:hypothetical protein
MLNRVRHVSKVQKIGLGVTAVVVICCSCLGLPGLLPASENEEVAETPGEIGEAETRSDNIQPELVTESRQEPTHTPLAPTDIPQPSNTLHPTNTASPTPPLTAEPETGQLILASNEIITGQLAAVVRIVDGDTIEVAMNGRNYRVRYIGMDTPAW